MWMEWPFKELWMTNVIHNVILRSFQAIYASFIHNVIYDIFQGIMNDTVNNNVIQNILNDKI